MYGFQDLPSQQEQRFWIYTPRGNGVFSTWNKPPGISFVQIICIGGGSGGGSGATYTPGTLIGGGGGGGTGGTNITFLPAFLIPDTLYISPGTGGKGGIANGTTLGVSGSAGTNSYVCFYPSTASICTLCIASGSFGGAGASSSTNVGGVAFGIGITGMPAFQTGVRNLLGGVQGSSGLQTPTAVTQVYRICQGAGGAGYTTGNITNNGASILTGGEFSLQVISSGSSPGGNGSNGFSDSQKFNFVGGSSGASSTSSLGGFSGNGGYGSGGAGGSCGTPSGSNGGNGGDGLVIITCG